MTAYKVTHMDHQGGTKFYRVIHDPTQEVVIYQWGKKNGNASWADGQFKIETPHNAGLAAREKIWAKVDKGYERTADFDVELPDHYFNFSAKQVKSKFQLTTVLDAETKKTIQNKGGQQTLNPNQRKAPEPQDPAAWNGQNGQQGDGDPANELNALLDRLNTALVKAASGEEAWVEYATLSTAVQEARESLEQAEATFEALESLVLETSS